MKGTNHHDHIVTWTWRDCNERWIETWGSNEFTSDQAEVHTGRMGTMWNSMKIGFQGTQLSYRLLLSSYDQTFQVTWSANSSKAQNVYGTRMRIGWAYKKLISSNAESGPNHGKNCHMFRNLLIEQIPSCLPPLELWLKLWFPSKFSVLG